MAKDEINAFLGAGTSYVGKLDFTGSVRIDGIFLGEVKSDGILVIGREARIEGQVHVGQLVLSGRFDGDIIAAERVVLHKTAVFHGKLRTPGLVVEEGAVLEGDVVMSPESGGAADADEVLCLAGEHPGPEK